MPNNWIGQRVVDQQGQVWFVQSINDWFTEETGGILPKNPDGEWLMLRSENYQGVHDMGNMLHRDEVMDATPCVVCGYIEDGRGQDVHHTDNCCQTMICREPDPVFRYDGVCMGHDMGWQVKRGVRIATPLDPWEETGEPVLLPNGQPSAFTKRMFGIA